MGQYYLIVNPAKKQFIHPHVFGDGLKFQEFATSSEGVLLALAALLADGNGRGMGDLDITAYGKRKPLDKSKLRQDQRVEWENTREISTGKTRYDYGIISTLVGSWAGDKIVLAGDYSDPQNHFARDLTREWCIKNGYPATAVERQMKIDGRENGLGENSIDFSDARHRPNLHRIALELYTDISVDVLRALCDNRDIKASFVEEWATDSAFGDAPRFLVPACTAWKKKFNTRPATFQHLESARFRTNHAEFLKLLAQCLRNASDCDNPLNWEEIRTLIMRTRQDPICVIKELLKPLPPPVLPPHSLMVDVGNVDWKMLREQKLTLVELFSRPGQGNELPASVQEAITGIVHLLDSVQDQAAEILGEKEVFGKIEGEPVEI